MAAENSVLKSVKKYLGLSLEDSSFDHELCILTNAIFQKLEQLGYAPPTGYLPISDDTKTWSAYFATPSGNESFIQSYISLSVRLLFDPPASSIVVEIYQSHLSEIESRIVVPAPEVLVEEEV